MGDCKHMKQGDVVLAANWSCPWCEIDKLRPVYDAAMAWKKAKAAEIEAEQELFRICIEAEKVEHDRT